MGQSLWKLLRGEDLQTIQEAAATLEVEEEAKIELAKVRFCHFTFYLSAKVLDLYPSFRIYHQMNCFCCFPYLPTKGPILQAQVVKTDNLATSALEPETFTGLVDLEVASISPPSR